MNDQRIEIHVDAPTPGPGAPVPDSPKGFYWVCGIVSTLLLGILVRSWIAYAAGSAWQMLTMAGTSLVLLVLLGALTVYWRHGGRRGQIAAGIPVIVVVVLWIVLLLFDGLDLYLISGGILILLAIGGLLFRGVWHLSLIAVGIFIGGSVFVRSVQPLTGYNVAPDPVLFAELILLLLVVLLALGLVAVRFARVDTVRARMVAACILAALLPGVLVAGASFIFGYGTAVTRLLEVLDTASLVRAERLDEWVRDLTGDLDGLGALEKATLQRLLLADPETQGYQDNSEALLRRLSTGLSLSEDFDVLLIVDADGELILSTRTMGRPLNLGDSAYLERGLQGSYTGPIVYSGELEQPAITVAVPIEDDFGNNLGVLVGQAQLGRVREILSDRTGISEPVTVFIIDESGELLFASPEIIDGRSMSSSTGLDAMLTRRVSQLGRFENDAGDIVIGSYRWLPPLQIGLVMEAEPAVLLPAMFRLLGLIVSLLVCSVLLAAGVIAGIMQGVFQPLVDLVRVTSEVAGDNLDIKTTVEDDEVGRLTATVNQISGRLNVLTHGLEERVALRTAGLTRRSAQLEIVARVAREAASRRDTHEMLRVVVEQIAAHFDLCHVGMYLVDATSHMAILAASSAGGDGQAMVARGFRLDLEGEGSIAGVVRTGEGHIVPHVESDPRYAMLTELPETHSELSLPLKVRDEVIGVLDMQSQRAGFFEHGDEISLQPIADHISLALENAALSENAEVRCREIGRLVGAQEQSGWQQLGARRASWDYIYDGLEARPLADTDLRADNADLVLPLGGAESRFGVVKIQLRPGRELTADHVALAQAITEEAGLALEHARLFGETQDALIEVGTLYRSSRAIIDAETPQAILRAIADNAATPELERLVLIVPAAPTADGQARMRVSAVVDAGSSVPDLLGRVWSETVFPTLGKHADGQFVLDDVATDESLDGVSRQVLLNEMGLVSALLAPLSAGQQVVGWFVVGATHQRHTFSVREQRLCEGMTDLVAAVVRNFQLLDLVTDRAERAQALETISARMREALDMDLILQTALHEIGESLGLSNIEVRMRGDSH